MWQLILELGADIILFFEDIKFWKKKRARRKLEKEHGLPKRIMIYPSVFYYVTSAFVLICSIQIMFLVKSMYFDGEKQLQKIAELELLLKSEKEYTGIYPERLNEVIRKNPLRENIIFDIWGNEYHYEVILDGKDFVLLSKGKDGILNTDDDIIKIK